MKATAQGTGDVNGVRPALLFCNHWPGRLEHDARLAEAARVRFGVESIVIVHGVKAVARARRAGFDHTINVGQPRRLPEPTKRQLEALANVERTTPGRSLREDVEQDRWLHGRFDTAWSLTYLARVHTVVVDALDRFAVVAAIGEVNYAAFRLVRRVLEGRGTPYLMFSFARIYSRFYLDPTFYAEHPRAVAEYRRFLVEGIPEEHREPAGAALDRIVKQRQAPNYTQAAQRRTDAERSLSHLLSKLAGPTREDEGTDGAYPAARLPHETGGRARIGRFVRSGSARRVHRRLVGTPQESSRRAVYLMHDSPEYTIDTLGWPYRDQTWLVRRIAESLPLDTRLIVKDHVTMVGRRPAEEYERLASMPNVDLVPETLNARELISGADIVFTVSGTAALEALAFGIPAIAFSPVFYTHFEGITRCEDLLRLPGMIRRALDEGGATLPERAMTAFAAIHAASHPGTPFMPTRDWRDSASLDREIAGFLADLAEHVPILGGADQ